MTTASPTTSSLKRASAASSLTWATARAASGSATRYRAIQNGFVPDSISTDLHTGNVHGVVVDMITTMNKILNIGVPLFDVIKLSTINPANEIGHPELGHLSVGAEADVAVLKQESGEFGYIDCGRAKLMGDKSLDCAMTLRAGEIVYDPAGLSMPDMDRRAAALLGRARRPARGQSAQEITRARRAPMNLYRELGLGPMINANATLTRLGGSVMPPEVVRPWSRRQLASSSWMNCSAASVSASPS